MHRPSIKHVISVIAVVVALVLAPALRAQDGVQTFQGIQIERALQPGSFITFLPPTVAITPYTLIWPATPPTPGQALTVTSAAAPWQLGWTTAGGTTIELVASVNGNLRRIESLNSGGLAGVPGSYSNDFQGDRQNASQTASGNYAVIGGGSRNTASGNYSLVLGGFTNTASGEYSLVAGGRDNTSSGSGSAILGGQNNSNSGANAAIGGGQNNTITAAGTRGFIGGGQNNTVSGVDALVLGGNGNTASGTLSSVGGGNGNVASDTAAFVGGGVGNTASGIRSTVIGGGGNAASGLQSYIGGGQNNTASGSNSTIGGGSGHVASGSFATIAGGQSNTVAGNWGYIGGGQSNEITSGTHGVIAGGQSNTLSGNHSIIGGGQNNSVQSNFGAIPGGRRMTLAAGADGTFGFNAIDGNVTLTDPNAFVIANADLWIANNNNTSRAVRWYTAQNTAGAFPAGNTRFVAFVAPNSTFGNNNNTYTLPDRVGAAQQVLRLSAATATTGTMEWVDGVTTVRTATVDVTADNQAITAAQMDNITYLRLSSNGTPATRTVTLANGVTSGHRLIIRAVAGAGNGIEIEEAANVELNGAVTLEDRDTIMLVWDAANTLWVELSRSNN